MRQNQIITNTDRFNFLEGSGNLTKFFDFDDTQSTLNEQEPKHVVQCTVYG